MLKVSEGVTIYVSDKPVDCRKMKQVLCDNFIETHHADSAPYQD